MQGDERKDSEYHGRDYEREDKGLFYGVYAVAYVAENKRGQDSRNAAQRVDGAYLRRQKSVGLKTIVSVVSESPGKPE